VADKILVLPFIIEVHDEKGSVSYPAELAGVVCSSEFQRRKTGLLKDAAEKTSFLSKLYYPIWVAPLEDSCVIIDGLASSSHNFTFKEPAKTELFVEDLKKNSAFPQEFAAALSRQAKNAEKFTSPVNLSFKALIADKELLKFFSEYLKNGSTFSGDKAVFLPSEIDEPAAAAARETVANCLRRIYANVKGLQYALEVLSEEVDSHEHMLLNEVGLVTGKCEAEVASLTPEVEKNIEKLKLKRDAAAAHVLKGTEKKAAVLEKKREKYLQKLQRLEQRKESVQKKRSQTYVLEKYDQEINGVKKEIRLLSTMIEAVKKEGDKSVKKFEKEFRAAAALEEDKIKKLNSACEAKIGEKKKQITSIASETAAITKSFAGLMDELKRAASVFREQIAANWKLDDLTLVCVPIYLAGYAKGSEERYSLFSPVTISDEVSVLQELRKMLTLASEPRLKLLMRSASVGLQEMLGSAVIKKMQNEETFRQNVTSLCRATNLLEREDFERTLNEGLTEAEQKRWITAEEAAAVLSGIKGEET
jgi:hypothetical protein